MALQTEWWGTIGVLTIEEPAMAKAFVPAAAQFPPELSPAVDLEPFPGAALAELDGAGTSDAAV